MKIAEAKIKGSIGILSSFSAVNLGQGWKMTFCDDKEGEYCTLEGFRGGIREFRTLENLLKVSREIMPNLDSFKVIL